MKSFRSGLILVLAVVTLSSLAFRANLSGQNFGIGDRFIGRRRRRRQGDDHEYCHRNFAEP